MRLPLGKIPQRVLEKLVLARSGASSERVVLGPSVGIDFAVIRVEGGYMVVSSDPVTGVWEDAGWIAVNVSGNDVATSGAKPELMESVILLPEDSGEETVNGIAAQMDRAAKDLGISIVGGHTELTPRLDRPVVVTTAFGFTDRYVTAAGAKPGDALLMTKTAAVEGTYILAKNFQEGLAGIKPSTIREAQSFIDRMSIIQEATAAFSTGYVHAMHDPTEGGVLGGIYEMAVASNCGVTVEEGEVPVAECTRQICRALEVDPLRLISSGILLMAVEPVGVGEVVRKLQAEGGGVTRIGEFTEQGRVLLRADGGMEEIRGVTDELWRLHAGGGGKVK